MSELKGAEELRARLARIAKEAPKEFGAALYQETLVIEKECKKRCPVAPDGGTLRASIIATKPKVKGGEVSTSIEAGGPSTPYATAVHEHLSEHSPSSWKKAGQELDWNVSGTGPKFIEGPVLEAVPNLPERLAARIDMNRMAR